ncbi:MAG: protein kinase [Verrucomicrobia bacterium]|nr:protein kinase [Verrucomicrobiota bacterium]
MRVTAKSDAKLCPDCGQPILGDQGLCPQCVLSGALELGTDRSALPGASPRVSKSNRRFGDYELIELIGRGGMGVVYKAHQFSLNQEVALKMVLESRASSNRAIRRFQLEAEVAARLRHPNIVRIYHIGDEDGDLFFTMELIAGESLSRLLARSEFRLPPSGLTKVDLRAMQIRIARLIAKTARAVQYAHDHGVLHRDIKPGNIIMDAHDEPHLTDFGLAQLADEEVGLSDSGSIAGTPAYMSPEQARGDKLTAASDTYSLGVILYELLTGRVPFQGATPVETLRQVTDMEATSPTQLTKGQVDADLATICLKCLEKNPVARYASAKGLAEDLERWIAGVPIHARPVGDFERLQRWVRRNPVGASFIAVLVFGIVVTTILAVQLRHSQTQAEQARQEAEKGEKVARQRAEAILAGIIAGIERLWPDPNRKFEYISSEQLSAFLDEPKREVDYDAPYLRLTMGVSVTENPLSQVSKYAGPFAEIENRMTAKLGQRVLLDLKLFKYKTDKVVEAMAAGPGMVNFSSVGPLAYVKAKAIQPGLIAIARDENPKPAVFFARKGTGITNINQITGKRMAFGSPAATISLLGKVQLARAGVHGADLLEWRHWYGKSDYVTKVENVGLRVASLERSHSHAAAIAAVTNNLADIGVARREYVQDLTKHWLEIVSGFESPPQLWVASTNMEPAVVEAFRQALISTKTIEFLGGPDRRQLSRIVAVEDAYYDSLRRMLTNEVRAFEGERQVQSADPRELFEDDE